MSLLQNTKKGSQSIDKYMLKMTSYVNGLQAAGNSISEEQQIIYVLIGVGSDYESVVVNLTSKDKLTLQEVQFMLRNHEMRLQLTHSIWSTPNFRTLQQCLRCRGKGNGSYQARGNSNGSRVIYPFCGRARHTAQRCYRRFDVSFTRVEKSAPTSSETAPHANIAFSLAPPDDGWNLDSGASNHVILDANNLMQRTSYKGMEKMVVGYSPAHKGYKCLHPSGRLYIAMSVTFAPHLVVPQLTPQSSMSTTHLATTSYSQSPPPSFPHPIYSPFPEHNSPTSSSSESTSAYQSIIEPTPQNVPSSFAPPP
uniref:Uncharacterized protein n=1 Tax=Cannabis sativa TaxID=3483 RepID=A0A803Q8Z8_CANSA